MSNKRIAINTAAIYLRFVLSAGLAIFSSRWVINSLGHADYGIFSLVGTLIIFVTALNNLLANSAARNFAYAVGQNDLAELSKWLNAAVSIHCILAVFLVAVGWPIGEYVIANILQIPADRINVSISIFRISLVAAFVAMLSVPFVAMFTAKQQMGELAFWGALQAVFAFGVAWRLTFEKEDHLWFYAVAMAAISIVYNAVLIVRGVLLFEESRFLRNMTFEAAKLREICAFAFWNLFGWSGVLLRDQGAAVLLNLFFGPSANAAYAIAVQISNQTSQFSNALISAFSPVVTASEGAGNRTRMLVFSQKASVIGTVLALILAIPLSLEMEFILEIWLVNPPEHTATFCRLMLATFVIDRVTSGYMLAVNAAGKISAYQATVGATLLLTLPIAWTFLKMGYPPTSICVAFVVTMTIASFGRVLWGKYLFSVSFLSWLIDVVRPCALVASSGFAVGLIPLAVLEPSGMRLLLVGSMSIVSSIVAIWIFVVNETVRLTITMRVRRFFAAPCGGT